MIENFKGGIIKNFESASDVLFVSRSALRSTHFQRNSTLDGTLVNLGHRELENFMVSLRKSDGA